jgi:hypothetical protein
LECTVSLHKKFKTKIILSIDTYTYVNSYRDINIYSATVPDRMHHLDLGLFRWQIEFTLDLLRSQHDNKLVNELDYRLAAIPRYPELKVFPKGL